MHIGILSCEPECCTCCLVEAAVARGHKAQIINTLRCYIEITEDKHTIQYGHMALPKMDAVIPRIGASVT